MNFYDVYNVRETGGSGLLWGKVGVNGDFTVYYSNLQESILITNTALLYQYWE